MISQSKDVQGFKLDTFNSPPTHPFKKSDNLGGGMRNLLIVVVVVVFTLKSIPVSLYPVPPSVRTIPLDAVDSRGHRLTYPKKVY